MSHPHLHPRKCCTGGKRKWRLKRSLWEARAGKERLWVRGRRGARRSEMRPLVGSGGQGLRRSWWDGSWWEASRAWICLSRALLRRTQGSTASLACPDPNTQLSSSPEWTTTKSLGSIHEGDVGLVHTQEKHSLLVKRVWPQAHHARDASTLKEDFEQSDWVMGQH